MLGRLHLSNRRAAPPMSFTTQFLDELRNRLPVSDLVGRRCWSVPARRPPAQSRCRFHACGYGNRCCGQTIDDEVMVSFHPDTRFEHLMSLPELDSVAQRHNRTIADINEALARLGATEADTNKLFNVLTYFWPWRCPGCQRSLAGILRRSRRNRVIGNAVIHHDHFDQYPIDYARRFYGNDWSNAPSEIVLYINQHLGQFVSRFDPCVVCEDCNNIDSIAKSELGIDDPYFSFSPREIRSFVEAKDHSKHEISLDAVRKQAETLKSQFSYRREMTELLVNNAIRGDYWSHPVIPFCDGYDRVYADAERIALQLELRGAFQDALDQ